MFIAVAVLLGIVIGLGIYTFLYAIGYSYLTNNPEACANCHVIQAQYEGWLKSSHHSAATCNDCHTPHNIIGKYAVKANNGFWHSFYFTSGRYPGTIEITKFDHKVTENACRRCHENITAKSTATSSTARPKDCNALGAIIPWAIRNRRIRRRRDRRCNVLNIGRVVTGRGTAMQAQLSETAEIDGIAENPHCFLRSMEAHGVLGHYEVNQYIGLCAGSHALKPVGRL